MFLRSCLSRLPFELNLQALGLNLELTGALLGRIWPPLGLNLEALGRFGDSTWSSWAPHGHILPLMDASGLDLEALGARFRTSQGSISDLSGSILELFGGLREAFCSVVRLLGGIGGFLLFQDDPS